MRAESQAIFSERGRVSDAATARIQQQDEAREASRKRLKLPAVPVDFKGLMERMQREQERTLLESVLPDVATIEKIMRYEAHLSRELYKVMHELEALQRARRGETSQLARLDVTGVEHLNDLGGGTDSQIR